MNGTVEVAAGHRCVHAEGPIWSDEERKLYWTDIESRALWRLDPGAAVSWNMPAKVCSLAFRERGGLLIAFEKESVLRSVAGAERPIVDVETDFP